MAGNFGEIGMGALGGAGAGAAIGSVIPGVGTLIGAGVGAIIGGIGASKKAGARDEALERVEGLPSFDPLQLNFLDQLQREKRSIDSGFTTDFQIAKDLNKSALAGGLSVAGSVASTNPALALSMIQQSQAGFSTGINQALGTISQKSLGLTQSIGGMINKVSQRKLDVETYKTAQQLGIATDALQTSNVNAGQFAASLPQYIGDIGQGAQQLGGFFGDLGRQNTAPGAPISNNFDTIMQNLGNKQVSPALSLPF